jgi:hypothetical protein
VAGETTTLNIASRGTPVCHRHFLWEK